VSAALDKSIVFVAPAKKILLLRRQDQPDTWEFPGVGTFMYRGALEPWTESTFRADVDAPFKPARTEEFAAHQWVDRNFALTVSRSLLHPNVPLALRRFDGDTLDQIMAVISDWQP